MEPNDVKVTFFVNAKRIPELRESMGTLLSQTICKVTFQKTDGTMRVMKCTLRNDLLPPPPEKSSSKPKKEKKENFEVLAVYEIDPDPKKEGWKSFRLDSLAVVEVLL